MKMGIWMGSTGTGRKIVSESYTEGPEVQSYHPFSIKKICKTDFLVKCYDNQGV